MIAGMPQQKFGAGLGLHRVTGVARALGLDLAAFAPRSIVIVGSNGKGSTAAMTAAALAQSVSGVGLFTSPHMSSPTERFQIDGGQITQEAMDSHGRAVAQAARAWCAQHEGEALGGFEFLFLLAARWFSEQTANLIVWEAGIGGRYDCTRLIRATRGALTSLDLEHMALLGASLELIACDKLDAFAPGAQVYLGPSCAPLRVRLEAYTALTGVRLAFLAAQQHWRTGPRGALAVDLPGAPNTPLRPPLAGAHQHANAAIAARLAFDVLRERFPGPRGEPEALAKSIALGLAQTRWLGRLEIIQADPAIVIDVGHTPQAARAALAGFLDMHPHGPRTLVCGVSVSKDAPGIIGALAPAFDAIIAVSAPHNARPAEEVAALARKAAPSAQLAVAGTMAQAYRFVMGQGKGPVLVAGGLYVAAAFKAVHLGQDPDALAFF